MSKHYNRMYNNQQVINPTEQNDIQKEKTETVIGPIVDFGPVGQPGPKGVEDGVIANCVNVNIRKSASVNSEVLCTVPVGTEVIVYKYGPSSTSDFYEVCTAAGIEGFCMKDYIAFK